MKKRFLSYLVAICMVCLLTMTSCSAAEVPAAGSGTNPGSAKLTSESQAMIAFADVPLMRGMPKRLPTVNKTAS